MVKREQRKQPKAKRGPMPAAEGAPASPRPTDPAKALEYIAGSLGKMHYVEEIADNLGALSSALHSVAHAAAMRVIADHGAQDDREIAVAYLKRWFKDFDRR